MSDGSEDDFAALFEASLKSKRIEQGQTIEGTIVAIGPEVAFVDVGGKGEATIDVAELKDQDGDIDVAVGGRIQAVVVSTSGGLILSRRLARGAAGARQLEDAYRAGLPVQGKVEREVKAGTKSASAMRAVSVPSRRSTSSAPSRRRTSAACMSSESLS
jgi:small subunit ribosomal protein S1